MQGKGDSMISSATSQVHYDFYGIQSADTSKQVPKNEPLAEQQKSKDYQKNSPSTRYISKAVDKNEYALFTSINQQKTLENAYTLFSQLLTNLTDKESYTADEVMSALPFAFDYDEKSLQITKTYSLQEYQNKIIKNTENDKNTKTMMTFYEIYSDIQKLTQSDVFENADKNALSKNDIFNAFYSRNFSSVLMNVGSLIEGETTIRGKLEGLDRNLSDEALKDLRSFLDKNKLGNGEIFLWVESGDEVEYQQLLNSNLSIDEFKEKYLKFKEKVEMKQKLWHKSSQDELQNALKSTQVNATTSPSQENSPRKLFKIGGLPLIGLAANGDITIIGKMMGFDKTMSKAEIEDLNNFVREDNALYGLKGGIFIDEVTTSLFDSTMSVEDFKEKWLAYKKITEQGGIWIQGKNETMTNANEQETSKIKRLFQATSKSEIYKNLDIQKTQNLLQDERNLNVLKLLFHFNDIINVKA